MEKSEGFPPIERRDARVLILGSLPGRRSIAKQQYYAHAQNAFWPIMNELFDIDGHYERRCEQLADRKIALWDVLAGSVRPGSMDAAIRMDTANPNDFDEFLGAHPGVELIAFNGRKAEQLFARFIRIPSARRLPCVRLPSTSPAYASMTFSVKLAAWRAQLGPYDRDTRGETNDRIRNARHQ